MSKIKEYINEYAWNYGRFYHVGDADKIVEKIGERLVLPDEYLEPIAQKLQSLMAVVELTKDKVGLSTLNEIYDEFKPTITH